MSKSILIFGGVRALGKTIAVAAVHSGEYETIRVVDSHIPELSCFLPKHTEAFAHIEVLQLNMEREEGEEVTDQAFAHPHVKTWTVVVNAYFETRFGFDEETQMVRSWLPARNISRGAGRWGCEVFVQLTTALSFRQAKKLGMIGEGVLKEPYPTSPRSIGMVRAEEAVRSVEGLPLVVLHIADLYGEGYWGTTEICLVASRAAVLQGQKEMKTLWDATDKFNTVHAVDAARATLHAANWYIATGMEGTVTFNIVDGMDTSRLDHYQVTGRAQGVAVTALPGPVRSTLLYSLKMEAVVNAFSQSFMDRWIREMDSKGMIGHHFELVVNKETLGTPWYLSLDGSKFRETTGFEYWYPEYNLERIKEVVRHWEALNLWA